MKIVVAILCLIISLAIAFPAAASVCRTYNGHQICIVSIKRSAKNYWEYRASISIDGVKGNTEVYNCRDAKGSILFDHAPQTRSDHRTKVQKNRVIPFTTGDPGDFVCSFFPRSS